MPSRDQVKCTKHRSKPTGKIQGLNIWHFEGGIRVGLLMEMSSELGHKGVSNQRVSRLCGKSMKLTSLARAEGQKYTIGRKVQT